MNEMQVDPEMDFSGSESSDFEDVYQVKDGDGVTTTQAESQAIRSSAALEDPEKDHLATLRETQGTATVIQAASEVQSGNKSQSNRDGSGQKLTIP